MQNVQNLSTTHRLYELVKTTLILSMVRVISFFTVLIHRTRNWESILISSLYYVRVKSNKYVKQINKNKVSRYLQYLCLIILCKLLVNKRLANKVERLIALLFLFGWIYLSLDSFLCNIYCVAPHSCSFVLHLCSKSVHTEFSKFVYLANIEWQELTNINFLSEYQAKQ